MKRVIRAVVLSSAFAGLAAAPLLAGEAGAAPPPFEHLLQFRGTATAGEDGTGVVAGLFPTTVSGPAVRYMLAIENGCASGPSAPCPPPAQRISVMLNDEVVFQDDTAPPTAKLAVALNPVDGDRNRILLTTTGIPNSAARVSVLAIRPLPVVLGGRSVLPLASTLGDTVNTLIVHNGGPENIALRLEMFNADGTPAGLSSVRTLADHATVTIDIGEAAAALGTGWVRGPVHVRWAARGAARVSTVACQLRRATDTSGQPILACGPELALDDYGPFPLSRAEAALLGF